MRQSLGSNHVRLRNSPTGLHLRVNAAPRGRSVSPRHRASALPALRPARSLLASEADLLAREIRDSMANLRASPDSAYEHVPHESPSTSSPCTMFGALRQRIIAKQGAEPEQVLPLIERVFKKQPSPGSTQQAAATPDAGDGESTEPTLRLPAISPLKPAPSPPPPAGLMLFDVRPSAEASAASPTAAAPLPASPTASSASSAALSLARPTAAALQFASPAASPTASPHGARARVPLGSAAPSAPAADEGSAAALAKALAAAPLLASLGAEQLVEMCAAARTQLYARHHVLFREGIQASWVGVLLAGQVKHTDASGRVKVLQRGGADKPPLLFGEEGGLAEPAPRFGTALSASDDCAVVLLPHAAIPAALRAALRLELVSRLLRAARGLLRMGNDSPAALAQLAPCCELRRYAKGEFVMREGDVADALFVLSAGRLAVRMLQRRKKLIMTVLDAAIAAAAEADGGKTVEQLSPHAGRTFFGEAALTGWSAERAAHLAHYSGGAPPPALRTASIVALEESWVLRIGSQHFHRLVAYAPDLERRMELVRATFLQTDRIRTEMLEREAVLRVLGKLRLDRLDPLTGDGPVEALKAGSGWSAQLGGAAAALAAAPGDVQARPLPLLKARLVDILTRHRFAHTAKSTELTAHANMVLAEGLQPTTRWARRERDAAKAAARRAADEMGKLLAHTRGAGALAGAHDSLRGVGSLGAAHLQALKASATAEW